MRLTRRHLLWTAVALGAGLVLAFVLRPVPVAVDVAMITRGGLRVTVDEEGETRLARRFVVSAPVAGRVLRIEARPGEAVRAGQTVATITPADPMPLDARSRAAGDARLRAAEAALERAQSDERRLQVDQRQAERDAERATRLFHDGSGSAEAAEMAAARARAAAEAANAAMAAARTAEFAVVEARAALMPVGASARGAQLPLKAPIGGVVLRRVQESETVVAPGTPLLEIGDLRELEIVTDLLSTEAVQVRGGAPVIITRWGGSQDLAGRVTRVEPSGFKKVSALGVEEQRVNVVVEILDPLSSRQQLGDGFRVEVRIVIADRPNVIRVPTAALFRIDGEWAVFTISGDRLVQQTVEIGVQNDQFAEVVRGLAEADQVVLYPGDSLTPLARVTLRNTPRRP